MDATTTLTVRVEPVEQARDRIRARLEAIDQGAAPEDRSVLILKSEADLARVFSEKNMELIRTIAEHEPASMRETARLVGRGIAEVSANLNELEALGVIRFEQDGRSKRPVIWYDEIDVEIPLPTKDSGRKEAPA
ncbi:hypothetical protein ACFQPA_12080 [Halomarina halobia]|uniref:Transcriptional regulator n=1 Tax=Halomarina halobia TaxID=3033386 RepID=A0ABD6A9D3_9EURY|nr:hypothetical protein [Halomarina sp. PSR21]